jgi:rubrerythrin
MGPVEALELALRREIESQTMYKDFYEKFPEARSTFEFLMNEEGKHRQLIEKEIVKLTRI